MPSRKQIKGQVKKHCGNHAEIHIIFPFIIGMIPLIPFPALLHQLVAVGKIIGIFHIFQNLRRLLHDKKRSRLQAFGQLLILLLISSRLLLKKGI